LLDDLLVGRERLVPETLELGAKRAYARRVELVDPAGPGGPVHHQPRPLEHLEVLRDGRPADRQPTGKLSDRPRPVRETLEDRAPRRIAEGGPRVGLVSHHLR
jgi:hypothetical protein